MKRFRGNLYGVLILSGVLMLGGMGRSLATESILRDAKEFTLSEADRAYWAFQPVPRPRIPAGEADHPVDRFVERRLHASGLSGGDPASPATLIRRLYFNLLGLPPSAEATEAFAEAFAHDPTAYERLVDRLLASPRYGERWARHWLDVVRFAQTNGYERDDEKPYAWRYRDYVIDAFNRDKPYDVFVREQVAGDELAANRRDGLVATGFYRLGVWDDEPDDERQAKMDELDDMVRVTSETFMGLTMGCARCHHHMFDPVSQTDYYAMVAFFGNVRPYARPEYGPDSATYAPIVPPAEVDAWQEEWRSLKERLAGLSPEMKEEKKRLEDRLRQFRESVPFDGEVALTLRQDPGPSRPTHRLIRGEAGSPAEEVFPDFPEIFGPASDMGLEVLRTRGEGRRSALARWIADEAHPLTARVMVNRVWKHHFGAGLVASANDFGRGGVPPTHPALLDWLAAEFMAHDWSIKHLHRQLLTSAAYRRSSKSQPLGEAHDPGNALLWKQNLRRLEAEVVRDRVLAASGALQLEMGGRGFFPKFAGEVLAGGSRPGRGWGASSEEEASRRSIYSFVKRTMMVPFLEAFDYSNTENPVGSRPATTVPTQALMLLNSQFIDEQSRHLARRLLGTSSKAGARSHGDLVRRAFRAVLSRSPSTEEQRMGEGYLSQQMRRQHPLARQIRFRPEVPGSLERAFRDRLPPNRFLVGPEEGWRYGKGTWGGGYEGIMTVEATQGPYALLDLEREGFERARWSGRLHLEEGVESAGLLWGVREEGAEIRHGFELVVKPAERALTVRPLAPGKEGEPLSRREVERFSEWIPFALEQRPTETQIEVAGETWVLPASQGRWGIRVWGGGATLDAVEVKRWRQESAQSTWVDASGIHSVKPPPDRLVLERALTEFCSLLFNLNEFIHVD